MPTLNEVTEQLRSAAERAAAEGKFVLTWDGKCYSNGELVYDLTTP